MPSSRIYYWYLAKILFTSQCLFLLSIPIISVDCNLNKKKKKKKNKGFMNVKLIEPYRKIITTVLGGYKDRITHWHKKYGSSVGQTKIESCEYKEMGIRKSIG